MGEILDGKAVAERVRAEVGRRVAALAERGIVPGLATVLVGDDPASRVYVGSKEKGCAALGIIYRLTWRKKSRWASWRKSRASARSILRECSPSPWAFRPTAMSVDCAWSRLWQTSQPASCRLRK